MFSRVYSLLLNRGTIAQTLESPDKSVFLRLVRWRKRRWVPKAASKIYNVRKPTPQIPEERTMLWNEYTHYRTSMKAIRAYLHDEREASKSAQVSDSATEEHTQFEQLLLENDAWNEANRKTREARQLDAQQRLDNKRLKNILKVEKREQRQKEEAQRLVQDELEKVNKFIRMDELEMEIEKALNQRSNYNFAIDTDGNRYRENPDGSTHIETEAVDRAENKRSQQQS